MRTDEDRAAEGGQARYGGDGPATGSNEPKRGERKEQDPDWVPRLGGDQSQPGAENDESSGKARDHR